MIKFIKFCFFAGIYNLFGYILYVILLLLHFHYLLANAVAFIMAVLLSFYLNSRFVFKNTKTNWLHKLMYFSFYCIQLASSTLMLFILTQNFKLNKYIAQMINVVLISIFSYATLKFIFSRKSPMKMKSYNNTKELEYEIIPIEQKHMEEAITILATQLNNFRPAVGDYEAIWQKFSTQKNTHALVAINNNHVIAYGSLTLNMKIQGGLLGYIEDIVTIEQFQGMGLASHILKALKKIAIESGCYKLSLVCSMNNVKFYEKNMYTEHGTSMIQLLQ